MSSLLSNAIVRKTACKTLKHSFDRVDECVEYLVRLRSAHGLDGSPKLPRYLYAVVVCTSENAIRRNAAALISYNLS